MIRTDPRSLLKTLGNTLLVFFASMQVMAAQDFQFRNYDRDEGICNSFVYSIIQDQQGYLMVGTGSGLCRFDGFAFNQVPMPDSLVRGYVTTMYRTSSGTLWVGFSDGNTTYSDGRSFRTLNTRQFTSGNINQIVSSPQGDLFIATQADGLIHYRDSMQLFDLGKLIYSIGYLSEGRLLVGTSEGLYVYRMDNDSLMVAERKIEEIPDERVNLIVPRKHASGFWVASASGIYAVDPALDFAVISITGTLDLGRLNIQHVFEDTDRHLWISTFGQGVIKLVYDPKTEAYSSIREYSTANGLVSSNVKQVYQDHEGNIWIGTFGRGLAMLLDEAFSFYRFPGSGLGNNILSIWADEDGYWFGSDRGLLTTSSPGQEGLLSRIPGTGLPNDRITAIYKDSEGTLWIGTASSGVYVKHRGDLGFTVAHRTEDNNENSITDIAGGGDYVWIATVYGLFRIQISTGEKIHFTNRNGLSHNTINGIYVDGENNAWVATTSRKIYRITPEGQLSSPLEAAFLKRANVFTDLTMDQTGDIWAASDGNGVFHFTRDSVFVLDRTNGLLSEYCKSIEADNQGNIWVGHRSGFSRINPSRGVVEQYSQNLGMTGDCNPNAMKTDPQGVVLIGTTQGLVSYDYRKDLGPGQPPVPNIVSVTEGDNELIVRDNIVLPYGIYRIRIGFIGLSYKNPEGVIYQYKLENYDQDWSDPSYERYVNYPRITDGKYRFLLRTCSSSGVCNEEPLAFTLVIKKPVWKTWWFYLALAAIIVGLFSLIVWIRERNQRHQRELLEKELAARTKEVVEQKEELEVKNREITDSINYAQRIQASILPPESRLKDHFPGSFIFFLPRDIVSGDFYWFDRLNEDRFLIVCADSTGHGVPGAFMSMIGSTLIKEFTLREDMTTPSLLLEKLDQEITQTLNQNAEMQRTNDGMDITICEINLKTRQMQFASAMRPIMLFHNNELMYIRGNRSSIGGEMFDTKEFNDQSYALDSGDIIYMFSDGYPDQFGGPLGKKFKMVRLKNLLEDIHEMPMEEQFEHIKNSFFLWKKEYAQVDDVLFMGIRIP